MCECIGKVLVVDDFMGEFCGDVWYVVVCVGVGEYFE